MLINIKRYVIKTIFIMALTNQVANSATMVGEPEYGKISMAYSCINDATLNNITVSDGVSSTKTLPISANGVFVDYPTNIGTRNYTFNCYYGNYDIGNNGVYTDNGTGYALAPGVLQIKGINNKADVNVSIKRNDPLGATNYKLQRAGTLDPTFKDVSAMPSNQFIDKDIVPNSIYYYRAIPYANNVPGSYSETIQVKSAPDKKIQLIIDTQDSALDTKDLTVNVKLGKQLNNEFIYDPMTMGQWHTKLIVETNDGNYETEFMDMPSGIAEFKVNTANKSYIRLSATSEFVTSIPELNTTINSSKQYYVTVLKGSPIEGSITSKELDSPAPKVFTLNLNLSPVNRNALETSSWEESNDNGQTWKIIENEGSTIQVQMPEPDRKIVRAKMVNKNNQLKSYTTPVQLLTYPKLSAKVTGPKISAPGKTFQLSSEIFYDGYKQEDSEVIVEWTVRFGNTKQKTTGPTVSISPTQQGNIKVSMQARPKDAPNDNPKAWANAQFTLTIKDPQPPALSVKGPKTIETGKTYRYTGVTKPTWGSVETTLSIVSEWVLPDGSIRPGDQLDWTPSVTDLVTVKPLIYRAWVDGYKNNTTSEKIVTYELWNYVWPVFAISMKQVIEEAPSDISLTINHNNIDMGKRLDGISYNWDFPSGITGRQNTAFPNRASAQIIYPGEYDIKVTIKDVRGHETLLVKHVQAKQAVPYTAMLKVGKSNVYSRAPMNINVKSTVLGGHPLDRVVSQTWKVDGNTIDDFFNRNNMLINIPDPGSHVISYTALSKQGITATINYGLLLKQNKAPVCQLFTIQRTYVAYAEAKCSDPDGKVVSFSWAVDGEPISSNAYRIGFAKTSLPQPSIVTIRAMDDSGDESEPVSITVIH